MQELFNTAARARAALAPHSQPIVCHFYLNGKCTKGASCAFQHVSCPKRSALRSQLKSIVQHYSVCPGMQAQSMLFCVWAQNVSTVHTMSALLTLSLPSCQCHNADVLGQSHQARASRLFLFTTSYYVRMFFDDHACFVFTKFELKNQAADADVLLCCSHRQLRSRRHLGRQYSLRKRCR